MSSSSSSLVHVNIVLIVKEKIHVLTKQLYRSPPQLWRVLSLEWLMYFEHILESLVNTCLLESFLDGQLTTYHSVIGEQLR